jgi:hypothetical protein
MHTVLICEKIPATKFSCFDVLLLRRNAQDGVRNRLPYWVRAISMPEELDPETGRLLPVDR